MSSSVTSQPISAAGAVERLHPIDWMRLMAIGGVFLVHSVHPFDTLGWHVKNAQQSEAISVFVVFLSSWGLGFFFLIAGAASFLSLQVRTPRAYLAERLSRLLRPFIIGYLLLSPLQAFLEETHSDLWNGSFVSFVPHFFGRLEEQIPFERGLHPLPVGWNYQLWFLMFLMWFSLLGIPLFIWERRSSGRVMTSWVAERLRPPGSILLLALPLAAVHCALRAASASEHDWGEFAFSFTFFLLGYLLLTDTRYTDAIRRDLVPALAVAMTGFVLLVATGALEWAQAWSEHPSYSWRYAWTLTLFSVQAWAWTVAAMSGALRLRLFRRPVPRSVRAGVMPFFMLHQPVILAVAFIVVQTAWSLPEKLAAVFSASLITTGLLVLIGGQLLRREPLSGLRKPIQAQGTSSVQPVYEQPIRDEAMGAS